MDINQQKDSKFRSLNKWVSSGVILGIILSSLLLIFSIAMVCILSTGIANRDPASNNLLVVTIFSILIIIFLLLTIGTCINITYTGLYLLDKQENTVLLAMLNLIFGLGISGYLILYGNDLEQKTTEEV